MAGAVSRQLFYFISSRSLCQDLFEIFLSGFSVAHLPVCPSCSALSGDSRSGRTGAIILPWHFPIVKRFFAIFSLKYHFWRFLQFLYRKAIVLTVFFLMFIQCVKPFAAKKSQCVILVSCFPDSVSLLILLLLSVPSSSISGSCVPGVRFAPALS